MIYNNENFPSLPYSWHKTLVTEACDSISVQKKIQQKQYKEAGLLAIIDQGTSFVGGYTDDLDKSITNELPVIIFGDHTRVIKYIDFLFAAGADGIKVLKPRDIFLPKLFYRFLQAIKLPEKGYARHYQYLRTSYIALPPLNEQKRIADKLDSVLARVDACRERLDRIPAILKRFRQSVLAAATSGKLTEEWREINKRNKQQWVQLTLGQIITGIEAGLNVQCIERPPEPDEQGLVKISAVTWGQYNDSESKTLPSGKPVPETIRIRKGDFLISRANTLELVGACVIVHSVSYPVYLSDKVLRIVMPDYIKPWLLYILRSPSGRRQIETLASGNQLSMRNLSQVNLRKIIIPIPPDDELKEITHRVESLLAYADRIEARYQAARARIDKLTPAILAKAFRGELVPQDPNDEPASVLLERIQKTLPATKQRGRSKANPAAAS